MKLFLIITLTFSLSSSIAQKSLEFSQVLDVPEASKDDLYNRANLWAVDQKIYNLYKLAAADPELGLLVLTGEFSYVAKETETLGFTEVTGLISFKLQIYVRDERYKYIVTDLYHAGNSCTYGILTDGEIPSLASVKKPKKEFWDEMKEVAHIETGELAKELLIVMSIPTELETDW